MKPPALTPSQPRRLLLHVGPMKTGTTYLQNGLYEKRAALADRGWLYPKSSRIVNQMAEMEGLLGPAIPWVTEEAQGRQAGNTELMLAAIDDWSGHVVMSAESLASVDAAAADRLLARFDGFEVDVVLTARDLVRLVPSQLQQAYKSGSAITLDEFMTTLQGERGDRSGLFWPAFSYATIAQRWRALDQVASVRLVTLPVAGDRSSAWTRFCTAAGWHDDELLRPPVVAAAEANEALRTVEIRMMIALNLEMARRGTPLDVARGMRAWLFADHLSRRDPELRGETLRLPDHWAQVVHGWSSQEADAIAALGIDVVGDLDDLTAASVTGGPLGDPTIATPEEAIALAATADVLLSVYDQYVRTSQELADEHDRMLTAYKMSWERVKRNAVRPFSGA